MSSSSTTLGSNSVFANFLSHSETGSKLLTFTFMFFFYINYEYMLDKLLCVQYTLNIVVDTWYICDCVWFNWLSQYWGHGQVVTEIIKYLVCHHFHNGILTSPWTQPLIFCLLPWTVWLSLSSLCLLLCCNLYTGVKHLWCNSCLRINLQDLISLIRWSQFLPFLTRLHKLF